MSSGVYIWFHTVFRVYIRLLFEHIKAEAIFLVQRVSQREVLENFAESVQC